MGEEGGKNLQSKPQNGKLVGNNSISSPMPETKPNNHEVKPKVTPPVDDLKEFNTDDIKDVSVYPRTLRPSERAIPLELAIIQMRKAEATAEATAAEARLKETLNRPDQRESYFKALFDTAVPEFTTRVSERIDAWKKGLTNTINSPETSEGDKARARAILKELDTKPNAGIKLEGGAGMLNYLDTRWSGGAGLGFGFEGVNDFVDQHVKMSIGAVVDSQGKPMPGVGVGVAFGESGENYGYSLGAGTVNFIALGGAADVRTYLNNTEVGQELAQGNAQARTSVGLVATGGASLIGGGGLAGVEYRQENLAGIERQREFLGKVLTEIGAQFKNTQKLSTLTFDQVPSLKDMQGGAQLFDWVRTDFETTLKNSGYQDKWSDEAKTMAKISANAEIISGKYDGLLKQKLGWNFAGVGAGIASFNGILFPWAGVGAEHVGGKTKENEEMVGHVEGLMARRYGLEPVTAKDLAEKAGITVTESDFGKGKLTSFEHIGNNDRVRINVPEGLEKSFHILPVEEVPVMDGKVEQKVTIEFGAGVDAVAVYNNPRDNQKNGAYRDILIVINPTATSGATIEGTHLARLTPRAADKTLSYWFGTMVIPNEVTGTSRTFLMVGGTDEGTRKHNNAENPADVSTKGNFGGGTGSGGGGTDTTNGGGGGRN